MEKNKVLKFITGNKHKFLEVKRILWPIKVKMVNIDLEEIQGLDPNVIIRHKLIQAFKHHKGEFIVEDGCTYFEALDYKLPGPLIKWFNVTLGNKGILKLVNKVKKNKVVHNVIIGYAKNPQNILFFKGQAKGRLVKPRGRGGFGFDPIVLPDGSKKTLAELKNENYFDFSARGQAAKKLKEYLQKNA